LGLDLLRGRTPAENAGIATAAQLTAAKQYYFQWLQQLQRDGLPTLELILPMVLSVRGKPVKLTDHYPFEPFFRTMMPEKLVMKTGRQCGKCCPVNELCHLEDGRLVPLYLVSVGQKVVSLDDRLRTTVGTVKNVFHTGKKLCYEVVTSSGASLQVTGEHRFRQFDGYVPTNQLTKGSRIAMPRRAGVFGTANVAPDRIRRTAYLIGDGCTVGIGPVSFTSACAESLREFEADATPHQKKTLSVRQRKNDEGELGKAWVVVLSQLSTIIGQLKEDGLYGKYAWEKSCPDWVFRLNYADTAMFLSRLWSTDGEIRLDRGNPVLEYTSTSLTLAKEVRSLLLKFGIPSTMRTRKTSYWNKKTRKRVRCRKAYQIRVVTRVGWETFLREIIVPGKPPVSLPVDREENNNRDTAPLETCRLISSLAVRVGVRWRKGGVSLLKAGLRLKPKYAISRRKLQRYVDFFRPLVDPGDAEFNLLTDLLDGDVFWDTVKSIKRIGYLETMDLEVTPNHNFVAGFLNVHNSVSQAASGILLTTSIPDFSLLFVTPLFEQVRRFSATYVKPMIESSPLKTLWQGTGTQSSVLQRSFINNSLMTFTFAFENVDRARGVFADMLSIDERQDFRTKEFTPILEETMSASPWQISRYTGTPKTLENGIEAVDWANSSQAEWTVDCGCGYENIASLEYDLLRMIGPWSEDITREKPGTICANKDCGKPLSMRHGFWQHRYPERKAEFAGYHVPQILLPMHNESVKGWRRLHRKMGGAGGYTTQKFYNEVLGESHDSAVKLVTVSDLKAAATLGPNTIENAIERSKYYTHRVLAIDWGGGGEEVSFTVFALLGMTPEGRIECPFAMRSTIPGAHAGEAKAALQLGAAFKAQFIVHDYAGAGYVREGYLTQAGFPPNRLIPMAYTGPTFEDLITYKEPTAARPNGYYQVDKTRSLALTCHLIRTGNLRCFNYDYHGEDDPGLLHDWLALMEDKVSSRVGKDICLIVRNELLADDMAQACNMGCAAIWYSTGKIPDFAGSAQFEIDKAYWSALQPPDQWAW